MPSLYLKVWGGLASGRSSTKWISRPLLRNAITCNRSTTVCARNSISSKMEASGQKEMVVPVRPRGAGPVASSLPVGLPPFSNSRTWCLSSRSISSNSRLDRALTTETPTPWRPPDTLYPPPSPNFAPAWRTVRTISAADFPLCLGIGPVGMPRPLSLTLTPPSARRVTLMRVQNPAMASSTELSTTSQTRWWSPVGPVDPMYIPGRFRTGSRPSRTVMSPASYVVSPTFRTFSVFSATGAPFQHCLTEREPAHRARSRCALHAFGTAASARVPILQCSPLSLLPGPIRRLGWSRIVCGPGPRDDPVAQPRPARLPGRAVRRPDTGPVWPTQGDRRSPPGLLRPGVPVARGRPWPARRSPPTGRTAVRDPASRAYPGAGIPRRARRRGAAPRDPLLCWSHDCSWLFTGAGRLPRRSPCPRSTSWWPAVWRSRQGGGQQGLACGQSGQEGPGPEGIQFGEDVVEQQHRCRPQAFGGQLVGCQPEGEGGRPLLALGGMGAAGESAQREVQLVPVGTHEGHPPGHVPLTRLHQGVPQSADPRPSIGEADRCALTGQSCVVHLGDRGQLRDQDLAGLDQRRTGGVEPGVPHIESRRHLRTELAAHVTEQRRPLPQDLLDVLHQAGRLGIDDGEGLVQEPTPFGGTGTDHSDVLGGEHCGAQGVVEITPAADPLPVDHGPRASGRRKLCLDGHGPDPHAGLRPQDRLLGTLADHRLTGRPTKRLQGGEIGDSLEHTGLAGAVQPGDQRGPQRIRLDRGLGDVPEVGDGQRDEVHEAGVGGGALRDQ